MGRPLGSKNKATLAKEAKQRKTAIKQSDDLVADTDYDDFAYLNNPRLKRVGAQISFTAEQIEEFKKCSDSPSYFIETYLKILGNDDEQPTVHPLFPHQTRAINAYHNNRFTICMFPRQSGKTTVTTGFIIWYVLFNTYKNVGILAQKEKTAIEILNRIKIAYEYLPLFLQQGVAEWSKTSIVLENGCRILSESTASGAIRGFTIHLLYLDEFAHVPPNIAEDFFTSVWPTISANKNSKMIITSTPKGLNLFYRFWVDAEKEITDPKNWNGFRAVEAKYTEVPGRDQEWADQQLRVLKERKFNQEVLCQFLGSSNTLISGKKLRELAFKTPQRLQFDDMMQIYEDPIENHAYVLAADSSEGKELDYHCFSIFDVTDDVWRVVAKFRDNAIDELAFASYIYQAALHYNNAYCIVENNAVGGIVLKQLVEELEYENVFYTMTKLGDQSATQSAKAKTPGVKSTKRSKTQGCSRLKLIVENNQLIVQDFDMISELSTFILQKNGVYAAEQGYNDDTVATLWLFAWFTNQSIFREITDLNLREKLHGERIKQMDAQMPAAVEITGPNYKTPPLEVLRDENGNKQIWVDSSLSWDEAMQQIQDGGWINNEPE